MERPKGMKWNKINGEESPSNNDNVHPTKLKAMDDEQRLVHQEDDALEQDNPPPLVTQRPIAAWAVGGLCALFLIMVILVVRGGTSHASRTMQVSAGKADWIEVLPSDVVSHLDREVEPCDDFYAFSCGAWLNKTEIPEDKANLYLAFTTVHDENQKVLKDVMQQGWPLVGELYDSCMNFSNTSSTTADDASLQVLSPVLEQIAATTSKKELFQLAGLLSKAGPSFLTQLNVFTDAREATMYALYASQSGLSLPDPQYYLDQKQFDSISDAFHAYITELFRLAGGESLAAASRASMVIAFEQALAPLFESKEKLEDPIASYNRMSITQAAAKYPLLFSQFMNGTGILMTLQAQNASVIVRTPAFFERVEEYVTTESVTLDTLKAVLTYQYISFYTGVLSEPFVEAEFSFHARTLRGQMTRSPRWKICLQRVTSNFPDLVGKYFALFRFDKASEQLATQLVTQIQASLQKNLGQVDWLDTSTRQAALNKFDKMANLIGHSTRSEHFPYELRSDATLAENMRIIRHHEFTRAVARIGTAVDRTKWVMSSVDVNAYYQATANVIAFPAGILQPPFFSRERHPVRNFGAIGSIMGHELTHGFDASGRYYAGDGNLQDWWSNATAKEFLKRSECLVKQYSGYTATSDVDRDKVMGHVNGNYTLSENIADNGGVKLAFDAYQTFISEQGQKLSQEEATQVTASMDQVELDLPADAADKLFFISFAQTFCSKQSDASLTRQLATDAHAPNKWRINGVASNSRDFARVFSCPADSPMNPTNKCQLW